MLGKNTILKAIHNCNRRIKPWNGVWMLGKNTILKAIHNMKNASSILKEGVNAG